MVFYEKSVLFENIANVFNPKVLCLFYVSVWVEYCEPLPIRIFHRVFSLVIILPLWRIYKLCVLSLNFISELFFRLSNEYVRNEVLVTVLHVMFPHAV